MALRAGIASKVRGAIGGILIGIVLFLVSCGLLWFNEGRAVAEYRAIGELADHTVEISPLRVNPDHEGSPVYLSHPAEPSGKLRDAQFGIERTAMRLVRTVEMLQWQEERPSKRDLDRGAQPSYRLVWAPNRISSEEFLYPDDHENPAMRYITKTWMADKVTMGAFRLPAEFILKLDNYVPVETINAVPTIPEGVIHIPGGLFIGDNPNEPQIGELRISFKALDPQAVSLIARQFGDTFDSYIGRTGKIVSPIRTGAHSRRDLIAYERRQTRFLTMLLRGVGYFLMLAGLAMASSPLTILGRVVPPIGRMLNFGLTMVCALVAGIFTLGTIMLAWVMHRPAFAVGLGVLILFLLILVLRSMRKPDEEFEKAKRRLLAPV